MYWTDAGTNRIERSTMDGNSRRVLHSSGLSNVYGLTLDYQNQTLYWVDYSNNRIEKSSVTGSNRDTVRTGLRAPWGVTYHAGRLYWTDWSYDRIYSILVTSPASITTITSSSLGGNPNGIHVVAEERQPLGWFAINIACILGTVLSYFCYPFQLQILAATEAAYLCVSLVQQVPLALTVLVQLALS